MPGIDRVLSDDGAVGVHERGQRAALVLRDSTADHLLRRRRRGGSLRPMKTWIALGAVATDISDCPRCGADKTESCARRLLREAEAADPRDERTIADLRALAAAGTILAHPERIDVARQWVDSAEAYGLVETRVARVPKSHPPVRPSDGPEPGRQSPPERK